MHPSPQEPTQETLQLGQVRLDVADNHGVHVAAFDRLARGGVELGMIHDENGTRARVLELVIQGKIAAYISPAILNEFKEVLARPKFGLNEEACFVIAREVEDAFSLVYPQIIIDRIRDDPDDNAILECALTADAEYIVSGDPHLLDLGTIEEIRIISPSKFISLLM